VLATDISPAILRFALTPARRAGLTHVETLEPTANGTTH
jgi:hypothetical protein